MPHGFRRCLDTLMFIWNCRAFLILFSHCCYWHHSWHLFYVPGFSSPHFSHTPFQLGAYGDGVCCNFPWFCQEHQCICFDPKRLACEWLLACHVISECSVFTTLKFMIDIFLNNPFAHYAPHRCNKCHFCLHLKCPIHWTSWAYCHISCSLFRGWVVQMGFFCSPISAEACFTW